MQSFTSHPVPLQTGSVKSGSADTHHLALALDPRPHWIEHWVQDVHSDHPASTATSEDIGRDQFIILKPIPCISRAIGVTK